MDEPEFQLFRKIPRLFRDIVVTEKIDGSNAVVWVSDDGERVTAGSRKRWITPDADNFGFARWVKDHEAELRALGPGFHYGEWWGAGIQRRYGLDHKRFSLFNTERWSDDATRPACCHVVPVLYSGPFSEQAIHEAAAVLRRNGSIAVPGFMNPEGCCVFHTRAGAYFKFTLDGDAAKEHGDE